MTSTYPFLLAAGVLVSLIWLAASGPARQRTAAIDAALSALAGGLIGARALYIGAHLYLYVQRPWEALFFWEGGLAWAGGAVGAVAGLALFALTTHRPFWPLADAQALPAAIIASTGWAGCWADACAYGRRAEAGLLTPAAPDLFGFEAPRWPTQALGFACGLATVGLLTWLWRRGMPSGLTACVSVSLIAAAALIVSFLRGDSVPGIIGLRGDAVAAGIVLTIAVFGIAWRSRGGGTV